MGAGLSGIGAACFVKAHRPTKSFAILEERHTLGGTWDLSASPAFAPTRTCTRSGSASDLGAAIGPLLMVRPSCATSRPPLKSTGSTAASGSTTASHVHRGRPPMRSGPSRRRSARKGDPSESRAPFCSCAAATTTTPRATGRIGQAWTGSRAASFIPSTGRTIWTIADGGWPSSGAARPP